ncbi:conserved hypothetical protein, partial [Ricinus communis]
ADLVVAGRQVAQYQLEQRRLAHPVAADQSDLRARRQADGRLFEEPASPGVESKVVDLKHLGTRGWRGGGARL